MFSMSLAVRHVTKKPCIHMISTNDENPFDTSSNRAIVFDLKMRGGMKAKTDLKKQIEAIKKGKLETDNPIGTALTLRDLKSSGDTQQYNLGLVLEEMKELRSEIRAQQEPMINNEMIREEVFDLRNLQKNKDLRSRRRIGALISAFNEMEDPKFSQILALKMIIDEMRNKGVSESDVELQELIKRYNKGLAGNRY